MNESYVSQNSELAFYEKILLGGHFFCGFQWGNYLHVNEDMP